MNIGFSKAEKLKSRKEIALLFTEGSSIVKYPVRLCYRKTIPHDTIPIKAAVSVSKRNFKRAVDRNRIKRLLRESYRKNKVILPESIRDHFSFLWLYTAKEMPTSALIDAKVKAILTQFSRDLQR